MGLRRGQRRRERLHRRAMAGVAARERLRMARAQSATEVGLIRFSGSMFGGTEHVMRCLARGEEPALWLEIDGRAFSARSARGLRRMLWRRIWQGVRHE